MSWGAHGVMGELKSPHGMMALASLFFLTSSHLVLESLAMMPRYDGFCFLVPSDLRSFGLGGACHDTFCLEAFCSFVPCDLLSLGLGGALLLVAFTFMVSRPLSGLLFVLVRSCSFLFALASCSASRLSTVACLGLDLSCCGRVGFRFGLPGLFVRSCSRLPPPPPAPAWVLT